MISNGGRANGISRSLAHRFFRSIKFGLRVMLLMYFTSSDEILLMYQIRCAHDITVDCVFCGHVWHALGTSRSYHVIREGHP